MNIKDRLYDWPSSSVRALSGYVGLTILYFLPVLSGLRSFPDGDFTHHFLPFAMYQRQELINARLPVWNPYTYSGHPFLADVQAALFYPVSNLLIWLTLPFGEAGARLYLLEIEAALHVALAGLFVYLLVRSLTRGVWPGFIAGIAFAFSGYLTGYPPLQLAVLRTAIWLPLLLWLLLHLFADMRALRWWLGVIGVTSVAMLAGHAQTFLYICYAAAGWVGLLLVWRLRVRADSSRLMSLSIAILGLFTVGVAVVGLTAAQLLPSLEFASLSVRANVGYEYVSGGFPFQDTWQILLPGVLTHFSPLYVGVVGVGLAGAGCVAAVVQKGSIVASGDVGERGAFILPARWGVLFFATVSVVALLASYGGNGPLYPLLYRYLPGWNLFRGQERAAYVVTLGLSVMAGYGAAALPRLREIHRRRYALVFGVLVTGCVYAFGLLWQLPGRTAVTHWSYIGIAGFALVLAMALALQIWLQGWGRSRYFWLSVILVTNLFVATMMINVSPYGPEHKTAIAPELVAVKSAIAEGNAAEAGLTGRVYNEFRAYEDYGMRLHVEDVWGSSPLRLDRYAALFENFPLDRMWQLTGVNHVLTWRKDLFVPSELLAEFPQVDDTTYLHRLERENPRAWLASEVAVLGDEAAVPLLADHTFDLGSTALVAPESHTADAITRPGAYEIDMERLDPNRLRIEVESEYGGMLVVSENWMPGWFLEHETCSDGSVDCANAHSPFAGMTAFEPMRVDLSLIGIVVPAGSVAFDLVYWPDSIRLGQLISGVSILTISLAAAVYGVSRRKKGGG